MPSFNLVRDSWLPVRRRSGRRQWIAPWQITEDLDGDAVVAVDWPRPDFNGATLEFLIGLLATAAAPEGLDEWVTHWEAPPRPEVLRDAFEAIAFAFDLDGDGPRFMQELGGLASPSERAIASLLIDQPGEQGIERHTDHFVRHGGIAALSRAAAAIALFTAQTYSPAGGRGFLTSMRGGGPLTTLVAADPAGRRAALWHRLWPNVPDRQGPDWRAAPEAVFPWLAPTRSSQDHPVTTPRLSHPLQAFWGMPRRARLIFAPATGRGCDLDGPPDEVLATGWQTRQYGIKYEGWEHPLSPHVKKAGELPASIKGNPGGVSYRHWLGLVQQDPERGRHPAACVATFLDPVNGRAQACDDLAGTRLVAFGYDMDNMKARCWYQSEMPVPGVPADRRVAFDSRTAQFVRAADAAAGLVRSAVKRGLFARPADHPGDFSAVADRFWRDTEAAFFARLDGLAADDADDTSDRDAWRDELRRAALAIFDDLVPNEGIEEGGWRRVVEARKWLVWNLDGKIIDNALGLAREPRKPGRQQRRAA